MTTEANDTLRSKSYIKIVDLLGEGEWEEVGVGGNTGIYLNDVPVQNMDGSNNYTGLSLETRNGTLSQSRMSITDTTESVTSVGIEMKYNLPIEASITNEETDVVRVNVNIPQLTTTNTTTGDTTGGKVEYKIEWKSSDNPTWNTVIDGSRTYENARLTTNNQNPSVSGYSEYVINFTITPCSPVYNYYNETGSGGGDSSGETGSGGGDSGGSGGDGAN